MCQLAAMDIFRQAEAECKKQSQTAAYRVTASFVEIIGSSVHDLLSDRSTVQILTDSNGQNKMHPVKRVPVIDSSELMDIFTGGQASRQTAATAKNDTSSRSHSIFQIHVDIFRAVEEEGSEAECVGGCVVSQLAAAATAALTSSPAEHFLKTCTVSLVDLAGSEMSGDSMHHDADRRRECAHINKSLMALKVQ